MLCYCKGNKSFLTGVTLNIMRQSQQTQGGEKQTKKVFSCLIFPVMLNHLTAGKLLQTHKEKLLAQQE